MRKVISVKCDTGFRAVQCNDVRALRHGRLVGRSAAGSGAPEQRSNLDCMVRYTRSPADPVALYCRTRAQAEQTISALVCAAPGTSLVGFDFPFGYPANSGLAGGATLGRMLRQRIQDADDNANNRFAVAAQLNRELNAGGAGPFWGCPAKHAQPCLTRTRPAVFGAGQFNEHRRVDLALRALGIQSCWKLAYPASVGSQILMGMPVVSRLAEYLNAAIWPFETRWNEVLSTNVLAEIWPRLFDHDVEQHDVRDARQVLAVARWMRDHADDGALHNALGRPSNLDDSGNAQAIGGEGWIVGAGTVLT